MVISGCAGLMYETYSRPLVQGIKPTRIQYADGSLFEYEGIGFDARLYNKRTTGLLLFPLPLPFWEDPTKSDTASTLAVLLRPNRGGGTFNPSDVILRDFNGHVHHPTRLYRGPDNCETVLLHQRLIVDRLLPMEPIPLPAHESTCFDVTFAMAPPRPEQPFVIELAGLAFDGAAYHLPPIRFQKTHYLDTFAVP